MWGYIPNKDRLFESWTQKEMEDRTCITIAFNTSAYFLKSTVYGSSCFLKVIFFKRVIQLLIKDLDMSRNARELCVAVNVTVMISYCALSPLILRVVWGGPFIVLA